MKKNSIVLLLTAASLAGIASATEVVEKKTLTLDGAQRAIAAAVAQAHKNHAGGVIAVLDDGAGRIGHGSLNLGCTCLRVRGAE